MPSITSPSDTDVRRRALLALLLVVPAPSLGLLAAMHILPGPAGQILFGLSKVWLLIAPFAWHRWVDCEPVRVSRPTGRGLLAGLWTGLVIGAVIYAAYRFVGISWIDGEAMRVTAAEVGLGRSAVYIAGAVYWCLGNSLIEEYVWRWFVFRKCEVLLARPWAAPLSAGLFMVHHIFGLAAFVDWRMTLLGCLGVFTGGWIWALCFQKYRSVWPGYMSHVVADVVIFVIGWRLLF